MKPGFTRIDLIVVACIAFLAIALALPGCEQQRGGGRRAQCLNNAKCLSMALLDFESRHGLFPGYREPLAGSDVGWGVMILPDVERMDLWEQWQQGKAAKAVMEGFICPSDSPKTFGPEDGWSSYAVNTHVCGDGSGLKLDFIASKDGTGNTLLLAENLRIMKLHTWWDTEPRKVGFTDSRMADNVQSNHGGGGNVAFCDGHAIFLRDEIDDNVFKALVTPDGAEPVEADKL
jgi:prepilin-type processing-associated H-X9-DG protein